MLFAQKMLVHNIFIRADNSSPPIFFWKATDMSALICLFTKFLKYKQVPF